MLNTHTDTKETELANALNHLNALLSTNFNIPNIHSLLKSKAILLTQDTDDVSPNATTCLNGQVSVPRGIEISVPEGNGIMIKAKGAVSTRPWYVFHYANGESTNGTLGTGSCLVPYDAPIGTVVISGGFCGCVARVDKANNGLLFTHDNNGKCLVAPLPGTTRIASIDFNSYCEKGNSHQRNAFEEVVVAEVHISMPSVVAATIFFLKINNSQFFAFCSSYLFGFSSRPTSSFGFLARLITTPQPVPNLHRYYFPDPENSKFISLIDNAAANLQEVANPLPITNETP
ncbi:hypothetical protein PHLH6_22520 [Pseudomonas sp. Seg1]|uniref:hypothetical protein n=1 Tax=unclassified Pseudomonas TaxID=196821 RepID=UPI001BB34B57|nr:hypothetical protein [Pseudomonas sp. Seg1]BBP70248.1 hypothetical protein PHLH6_22520 [Pseudomonas sp. Seg1]